MWEEDIFFNLEDPVAGIESLEGHCQAVKTPPPRDPSPIYPWPCKMNSSQSWEKRWQGLWHAEIECTTKNVCADTQQLVASCLLGDCPHNDDSIFSPARLHTDCSFTFAHFSCLFNAYNNKYNLLKDVIKCNMNANVIYININQICA